MLTVPVEALGFQLWGIEYVHAGRHSVVRVFIDHENGISVDDCAKVSHEISGILDVEEPITMAYILEVSSPGMDRILFSAHQFSEFIGEDVKIKLNQMVESRRKIKGTILSVDGDNITIGMEDSEIIIEFDQIMRARINPVFDGV